MTGVQGKRCCSTLPAGLAGLVILALVWGLIFAAARAAAAENLASQYLIDTWKTQQGLPQNTVNCILQTQDGYLWMGTRFGLSRFDGVRFQVFSRNNAPSLPNYNILALTEDTGGTLWLATTRGLVRYKDRQFVTYGRKDGLPSDRVLAVNPRRQGGIWVGTDAGISCYYGGKFTNYTARSGLRSEQIYAVCEERSGRVCVAHQMGLQRLDPATGEFESLYGKPNAGGQRVVSVFQDRNDDLWFATDRDLRRLHEREMTVFNAANGLKEVVRTIFQDHDGYLWLGTRQGGLIRFNDGRFSTLSTASGLSDDSVMSLHEDREGNFWVGTEYGGVNRIQRQRVKTYTSNEGLLHDNVWSICQGRSGQMWIGTDAGYSRIFEVTNSVTGSSRRVRSINYSGKLVRSVFEDRAGNLWVGGKEMFEQQRSGSVSNYFHYGGFTNRGVHAIYEDHAGRLWFGAENQLRCLSNGVMTAFAPGDAPPNYSIRAILEDRSGNLWLGSIGGGLQRFRDGQFTTFGTALGLSSTQVWSLYEDADGAIWAGSEYGLNRIKNGRIYAFTEKDGLFDDLVNHIIEDDVGNFWISCNRGIYRVSRKALNDVAEGRAHTVRHVAYDEADGLVSSEANGECQPSGWKGADGRIWFPTIRGVVVFDPARLTDNTVLPPVVIEDIIADDRVIYGDDKDENLPFNTRATEAVLSLPAGRARVLEIRYTANSLVAPERVQFQYRLDGYDDDWQEAGARRSAFYTNLRPGNYRFRVKACNNHGLWNETGAVFAFEVMPYFYQTYSFYGLCLAAVSAGALGFHRLRLRQLRSRQLELVSLVDQRTADLRKEITERKQAEDELWKHKRHLEEEVARRTNELTAANEQLRLDIVARQQAEKEKLRIERKLQESQKLESLGVLAGGVAHDFNNLLTGILGNACLIRRELHEQSALQGKLEQIETASLRAADLAKQMLAYAGKGRLHVQALDLGVAVRETIQLLQLSIGRKIELKLELAPNLPAVLADATQIGQVIMNLVINASEAIGDQRGTITITTSVLKADNAYLTMAHAAPDVAEGEYVCLKVSDTGCGMDRETMARIFDPFFTTKFTGRGLGLAAVLGIVRGHKGALRVESELNCGATFTLLLPCAREGLELAAPPKDDRSTWRGKGTVLVVDDEEVVLDVSSSMLESIGFQTVRAHDGHAALELFTENPKRFSFVLLDLVMPQPDGEEAFKEIRRLNPEARVILMSGFDELDAASRFEGQGLAGFLHKPFKIGALREAARNALETAE